MRGKKSTFSRECMTGVMTLLLIKVGQTLTVYYEIKSVDICVPIFVEKFRYSWYTGTWRTVSLSCPSLAAIRSTNQSRLVIMWLRDLIGRQYFMWWSQEWQLRMSALLNRVDFVIWNHQWSCPTVMWFKWILWHCYNADVTGILAQHDFTHYELDLFYFV